MSGNAYIDASIPAKGRMLRRSNQARRSWRCRNINSERNAVVYGPIFASTQCRIMHQWTTAITLSGNAKATGGMYISALCRRSTSGGSHSRIAEL